MTTAAYGSWKSPITSDLITGAVVRPGSACIDGDDIYWLELRPAEAGRTVIVRKSKDGKISDVTGEPFNVRTLAHEYGGGAYTVCDGIIFFCNYADQRVYMIAAGKAPEPVTPDAKVHYADLQYDRKRNRVLAVQEDVSEEGTEALTTIVAISLKTKEVEVLVAGNDFYSSPRLHGDGLHLAWMSWNHPNMPWDESAIWAANVGNDGYLSNFRKITGGANESVCQPQWSPDGTLYYISDRNGWWNIYQHSDYEETVCLADLPAEFGSPHWVFGLSNYAFQSADKLICTYCDKGVWKLASIDVQDRKFTNIETPFTDFSSLHANADKAVFLAGSPTQMRAIVELDLGTGSVQYLKKSSELKLDEGYISVPETIEFDTVGNRKAYAFYYAPHNDDYCASAGELPPLIVKSHGGPTSACSSTLELGIQYWTSRGFAVVDVNYGGSTGLGRKYRERLNGSWGIVDVDDCIAAARHLVEQKKADPQRLAITGGSAGGYTTLCALTFHDVFKAGASYYGVSDLEALATDTHKFESRYLDRLVGPYPADKKTYEQRSPVNFSSQLKTPMIFLQGLEDRVVPPNQSETMVQALKKNGVPVAYITFEGEQHGFRKAANIKKALDSELYFYSRIFNFNLPDGGSPVEIENLSPAAAK